MHIKIRPRLSLKMITCWRNRQIRIYILFYGRRSKVLRHNIITPLAEQPQGPIREHTDKLKIK